MSGMRLIEYQVKAKEKRKNKETNAPKPKKTSQKKSEPKVLFEVSKPQAFVWASVSP